MNLKLNSTTIYMGVLVVIVIIFGVVYAVMKQPDNELKIVASETEAPVEKIIETPSVVTEDEAVLEKITVHIIGEVINSDVYTLDAGSRIKDVINMAGGVTQDADIESINLAAFLEDAEQVVIPKKNYDTDTALETASEQPEAADTETQNTTTQKTVTSKAVTSKAVTSKTTASNASAPKTASQSNTSKPAKININTASKDELMTLDGIGDALANSIIIYRDTHGGFGYIEEIKHVDRIGDKTFNKIKDYISVN